MGEGQGAVTRQNAKNPGYLFYFVSGPFNY